MNSMETLQNLSMFVDSHYSYSSLQYWLGQFLVQNYCQALNIIKGEGTLKECMAQEHIRDKSVFNE